MRIPALLPLSLACGLAGAAGALAAPRALAVRLSGFEPDQVRSVRFMVEREVEARVQGVGAGARDSLHAYGWIRSLDLRKVVWTMSDEDPDGETPGGRELVYDQPIRLLPGAYALYYFAGRKFHAGGPINLRRLFDKKKSPERMEAWEISLRVDAGERDAIHFMDASAAESAAVVRLAPLGDGAFARRRFRVGEPTDVVLDAYGEADNKERQLADRSWLLELASRKVVWAMSAADSDPAGGAHKNRHVRKQLRLPAGSYELVAATDDSHSPDGWNSLPPFAPEDWGVTLEAPDGSLSMDGLPEERTIVRLAGAGDDESLAATFRLERPATVRIYATGEWSGGAGQLADHGWIEEAATGAVVWRMIYENSAAGGGASKNRVFDGTVDLAAGTYRARYTTDDSHAFSGWNSRPPDDPTSWGISVSTFDPEARFSVVEWQEPRPRVESDRALPGDRRPVR